ncbi:MAG: tetratricopeptide repeat protein, partial [Elusimicrobiota bacterium]|nr:tetratricopeptide repeat protein [Elusimicrobiota bacterium]
MDNTAFGSKKLQLPKFLQGKKAITLIIGAVVAILIVVLIVIFVNQRSTKLNDEASDRLSEAYGSFAASNDEQGLAFLNDIVTNYPKTSAAYQARLFLGDYYVGLGNFNEALAYLATTSTDATPEELRPLALARIIYLYDVRNEFINARNSAQEFVNLYPSHFLTKSVYISLARYYALTGSIDDVRRVCNEILSKFP